MELMEMVCVDCRFIPGLLWEDEEDPGLSTVQIYRIFINDHMSNLKQYKKLLSADEISRAKRYHHLNDHDRFIISRAVLRMLLARKLLVQPSEIVFNKGINKKPFVGEPSNASIEFNVAHSGEYILIAISDSPIGTDVEYMDPGFHYSEVMKFAFNENEMASIANSASPLTTFYLLWSRKESLLKATGKGISDDLSVTVCLDGTNQVNASAIGSKFNWRINSFMVGPGYIGNIAYCSDKPIYFSTVKNDRILAD
ncbi:4'-phosphopantetheinyl transferase family protein [Flavitalea sp.]|nr:4'-phosphopantetheinyl transferase superfamily protein [Flavitalea sp.]